MSNQETVDSINVIGEGVIALNIQLANMLPSAAGYSEFEHKRDEAEMKFKWLVREFFAGHTGRFIKADNALKVANDKMIKDLQNFQDMQRVIESVTAFTKAIDKFIKVVFPPAG